MSRQIKGIIVSRLIVLISILSVPILIFIFFNLAGFSLWWSADPTLQFWVIRVLCPTVFGFSWFFFLILFANRFSETIEKMDSAVSVVPLRLKFFFGINAMFILFIFIFPMITPLVSALSFASLAWRLTTFKKEEWEEGKVPLITRILMITFSILPVFCMVSVLPDYLVLSVFLWNDVWIPLLDWIFAISYCLCTALAIGSLFILFANSGVSEYEQLSEGEDENTIIIYIKVFEVFLFFFFLFLAYLQLTIIEFFYNAGFIIVVFVSIINFFKGRSKYNKFKGHLFGYLLAAVFMGSNLLIFNLELADLLQLWSLVISAALFIFVFLYTFIKLDDID